MLSLVVPVYNTKKYLRRSLDSLINQTIDPAELEVVVIDDGSTDGSADVISEYADKYPDVIKVYTKTNGGQASARNLGIRMAKGEYVGFVDSDDYVDVTMFEKLYKLAVSEDADLVECSYHAMLQQDHQDGEEPSYKEIGIRGHISAHENVRELFLNPQVSPWNKLYKREILIENNVLFPEGMIYEDTSFYIKSLPFIKKHAYLDEKLYYYSIRQNSTMTANKGAKVADIFKVFDDIYDFYRAKGLFGEYKEELEYFFVKIAYCSNFSRIGRIDNRYMRREFLDKTFSYVQKKFPDYRNNKYFKGKTGLYIRSVYRWNCDLYSQILARTMVG